MADLLSSLFFFGRPFAPLYSLFMRCRSRLYRSDMLSRERIPAPVVSVGNLTMGGTGKTPCVRLIARLLAEHRLKPAIISRGYGGTAKGAINVVSDGTTIHLDAQTAGDEPFLLADSLPGIPVLTGVSRSLPCRFAVEKFGCNVLILDDGFQHMHVYRDIDLVLFNVRNPLGNSRVFPGGELREPISALARAHAFILTGVESELHSQAEIFADFLTKQFHGRPCFFSSSTATECSDTNGSSASLDQISESVYAFCGIANPLRFQETLKRSNLQIHGFTALRDHQVYDQQLLEKISSHAMASGAQALITTEKDMVKLRSLSSPLPIYSLILDLAIESNFTDFLLTRLALSARRNYSTTQSLESCKMKD